MTLNRVRERPHHQCGQQVEVMERARQGRFQAYLQSAGSGLARELDAVAIEHSALLSR